MPSLRDSGRSIASGLGDSETEFPVLVSSSSSWSLPTALSPSILLAVRALEIEVAEEPLRDLPTKRLPPPFPLRVTPLFPLRMLMQSSSISAIWRARCAAAVPGVLLPEEVRKGRGDLPEDEPNNERWSGSRLEVRGGAGLLGDARQDMVAEESSRGRAENTKRDSVSYLNALSSYPALSPSLLAPTCRPRAPRHREEERRRSPTSTCVSRESLTLGGGLL